MNSEVEAIHAMLDEYLKYQIETEPLMNLHTGETVIVSTGTAPRLQLRR